MALWDKVRQELDHAGEIAQGALDEGRVRLDALRARQRADKAAQALGYAVYRARQRGEELSSDSYARLSSTLAGYEAEAAKCEERLAEMSRARKARGGATAAAEADAPAAAKADAPPGDTSTPGESSADAPPANTPPA
jgi:hypothetical protein